MREALGDRKGRADALFNLGLVLLRLEDRVERAAECFEASVALCRELDDGMGAFYTLLNPGHSALEQGDLGRALCAFEEGQELLGPMDDLSRHECMAWLAEELAHVCGAPARDILAVHLTAAAAAARESSQFVLPPTARAYLELALARPRTRWVNRPLHLPGPQAAR
jgi:tetratricopeptide (TPR) repeat protein